MVVQARGNGSDVSAAEEEKAVNGYGRVKCQTVTDPNNNVLYEIIM